MSIGCSIFFTPTDRAWVGTPQFVHRVAAMFRAATFENCRVWRNVPGSTDNPWNDEELILDLRAPSIDEAVSKMRASYEYTTIMNFADDDTVLLTGMTEAVLAVLPEAISEGFAPVDVSIHLGRWKVYDQGGDFRDSGLCCLELGNRLGYPVELQGYLRHFLAVPEVRQFQQQLEEFSAQPWEALIELT